MYKPKILIVDDKPANIYALKELLHHDNLDIFEALSGEECLKVLLEERIDIILLDIQMPIMDGFETARYIHQNQSTKEIPIIFVTAANQNDQINMKGYQHGAIDIVFKPINRDILRMKIDIFMQMVETRKELQQQVELLIELDKRNKIMQQKIEHAASYDYLTNVGNRRLLDQEYHRYYRDAFRQKEPLALMMFDLDNFKGYNDCFGHTKGDEALKLIASAASSVLKRPMDTIGRYGGEEFLIVLPDTNEEGAITVATDVLQAIRNLELKHCPKTQQDYLTVSLGIHADVPTSLEDETAFLDCCDKALYEAKSQGKNRYCVYKNT